MMQRSRLPPELVDTVIDFLHNDKQALRQCSLVSKAWIPSSTLHLFATITWPPCAHQWPDSFVPPIQDSTTLCRCVRSRADFDILLHVLSTTPRIHHNVRELKLTSWVTILYDGRYNVIEFQSISYMKTIEIIRAVPHLRRLELLDFIPDLMWPSEVDFHARIPYIQELRVRVNERRVAMLAMLDVLSLFTHVHRLTIEGSPIDLETTFVTPSTASLTATSVDELDIASHPANMEKVTRGLCRLVDGSSMRRLQVHPNEILPGLEPLSRSAENLEFLSYTVGSRPPAIVDPSKLRSLSLRNRLVIFPEGASEWESLLRDLRILANPQLTSLEITLEVFRDSARTDQPVEESTPVAVLEDYLMRFDWGSLVIVLEGCPRLGELTINLALQGLGLGLGKDIDRVIDIVHEVMQPHFKGTLHPKLTVVHKRGRMI